MKKIEAIIRVEKLDALREAFDSAGVSAMTITEVKGRGKQKGIKLEWRVGEYRVEFIPKIKVEVAVEEKDVEKVIELILSVCSTDRIGDGKIFIYPIEECVRIRTKERGRPALG